MKINSELTVVHDFFPLNCWHTEPAGFCVFTRVHPECAAAQLAATRYVDDAAFIDEVERVSGWTSTEFDHLFAESRIPGD